MRHPLPNTEAATTARRKLLRLPPNYLRAILAFACIAVVQPERGFSEGSCDIPGSTLASEAKGDAEACRAACKAEEKCRAFVFVTGWNRCFLKAKADRQVPLRMHAGQLIDESARIMGPIAADHDESGKDLRRVSGVKSAPACAALCVEEPACKAFAFLDGYGDCWLKGNKGRLRPKTFTCAVMEDRSIPGSRP
jgi:hypothetical protein